MNPLDVEQIPKASYSLMSYRQGGVAFITSPMEPYADTLKGISLAAPQSTGTPAFSNNPPLGKVLISRLQVGPARSKCYPVRWQNPASALAMPGHAGLGPDTCGDNLPSSQSSAWPRRVSVSRAGLSQGCALASPNQEKHRTLVCERDSDGKMAGRKTA